MIPIPDMLRLYLMVFDHAIRASERILHRIDFFGRLCRLVIHVLPFAANTGAELVSLIGSPSATEPVSVAPKLDAYDR